MTDRDAMLQSICTDPRCDTPRLLFADWLEDRDECDRAEFIRVQVELARTPPLQITCGGCGKNIIVDERVCDGCVCNSPRGCNHGSVPDYVCTCDVCDPERTGSVRWSPLRRRERELWEDSIQQEMCRWILLLPVPFNVKCERGFIASIACSWDGWLRHAPALFWHEKQMVACECRWLTYEDTAKCKECNGTGRIPKPFPATAQPLEEVWLTTWPVGHAGTVANIQDHPENGFVSDEDHLFQPAKCRTCNGDSSWMADCPDCKGRPLNKWYCDDWPGLVFRMPEG